MKKIAFILMPIFTLSLLVNCNKVKQYTVTFDSNGGSEVKAQKVDENKCVVKPTDPTFTPTKEHSYTFNGWKLGDDLFDFNTPIKQDITLKANWREEARKYLVRWLSDDGTIILEKDVPYGSMPYFGDIPPKKEPRDEAHYYIFSNWDHEPSIVEGPQTYIASFDEYDVDTTYLYVDFPIPASSYKVTYSLTGVSEITVDWGDGTINSLKEHTYAPTARPYSYTIKIKSSNIENYVFSCKNNGTGNEYINRIILSPLAHTIPKEAFSNCKALVNINISDKVTSIGELAFSNCESLISIIIPNQVKAIGTSAFGYCTSLLSLVLPTGLLVIGESAFHDCESLINIEIPSTVTMIKKDAFINCSSLNYPFIPKSVLTIGDEAFADCNSLTDVYCGASSKPSGWSDIWLGEGGEEVIHVHWTVEK